MLKGILFDMDGTLVHTEPVGEQTLLEVCKQYNIALQPEDIALFNNVWKRIHTTMSFEQYVDHVAQTYNLPVSAEEYMEEFYTTYKQMIANAPALPGAEPLLEFCANTYSTTLVTASTTAQAQVILQKHNWTHYFDQVLCEEDYAKHKPEPDAYNEAAKRLGIAPSTCLAVEDSTNGVAAGKNANMNVVRVRIGNTTNIKHEHADHVVEDLVELLQVLQQAT